MTNKEHKLNIFETAFKTMSSQGRVGREVTEDADMMLSAAFHYQCAFEYLKFF